MDKTGLFLNGISEKQYMGDFKTPEGRIYKVDDCYIKQEISKVDTGKSLKELRDTFRGHLPEYLNSRAKYIGDSIPLMSYEMYLKELKDFIISGDKFDKGALTRMWVQGGEGLEVGNVIITNKPGGKYLLINELFRNNQIVSTVEYDLEEALKIYESLDK